MAGGSAWTRARNGAAALLLLVLAACGGGGGGGVAEAPALQGNFFPLAVGDRWTYAVDGAADSTVRATATRRVGNEDGIVVVTDDPLDGASEAVYVVSATGVREVPVAGGDAVIQAIGPVELMRFPLHVGDRFVQMDKTISSGLDFDGDGLIDPAAVRGEALVVGLESVNTPLGPFAGSLHLRSTITVDVQLTGLAQTVQVIMTLDDWYAPDVGPVRSVITTSSQGFTETRGATITAYRVGTRRSDSVPPAVQSASPADGSVQGITTSVRVVFSEAVDAASLTAALTLTDAGGQAVAGRLEAGSNSLNFWPDTPLGSGHYTARLAPTVTDLLGNPMGTAVSWVFDIDASGPQIVATTPANGAVDVALDARIELRFSEALDPSSLAGGNVVLRSTLAGTVPISASISGDTLTVVPTEPMARGSEYVLDIAFGGQGLRDVYGNLVAASVALRFTTDPGRFGAALRLLPEVQAESVAVGDVNGDGRQDVVLGVGYSSNADWAYRLMVYLQQPDGSLAAPLGLATRATYGCRPSSLVIGDVDADGRQDLLVAEFGCGVEVFKQGVDGLLRSTVFLDSAQSHRIRLADFNGDGRLDLLAIGWSDTVARLWLQGPGGTLDLAGTPAVTYHGWGHLAVGDVNGDGRTDFAVSSGQGVAAQAVAVVQQQADGSFAPPVYLAGVGGEFAAGVAIGDVDGDGRQDLLASFGSSVALWRQAAGGALSSVQVLPTANGPGPMVATDVNGDGRIDLVVLHPNGATVGVLLQQGNGTLAAEAGYRAYVGAGTGDLIAVGDVNGDGRIDLAFNTEVLLQRAVGLTAQWLPRPDAGASAVLRRLVNER